MRCVAPHTPGAAGLSREELDLVSPAGAGAQVTQISVFCLVHQQGLGSEAEQLVLKHGL